jgi:hypothetical protein
MANQPDWGKHGAIAAYAAIIVALLLFVAGEVWPPNPDRPASLAFLGASLSITPWMTILIVTTVILITVFITRKAMKSASSPEVISIGLSGPLANVSTFLEMHPTSLDSRILSPTANISYTAKLRLSLQNKSAKPIRVLPAYWLTCPGNVSVQCGNSPYPGIAYTPGMAEFCCRYQLEKYLGSWKLDKWKMSGGKHDEREEITVDPDWTFRIWIGMNPCVPHDILEKRRRTHSLGTLILPLTIGNDKYEWRQEI